VADNATLNDINDATTGAGTADERIPTVIADRVDIVYRVNGTTGVPPPPP
jgi:teichoic acid transport system ATP-binding protein